MILRELSPNYWRGREDNRKICIALKLMEQAGMIERTAKSKKLVYYRLSDNSIKILQK